MPRSVSLVALLMVAAYVQADDLAWPQFRGPGGSGVAPATAKPPLEIGPTKNVAWKVAVPAGVSSPIVVGDRLILTAFDDGKLYTLAYSRANGKELWRKAAPAKAIEKYMASEGSPAASTPATDGKRIVSYFGSCGLICYDLDGLELWRYELPTARTSVDFGSGTSPIIADGLVILLRDVVKDSKVIALDMATGSVAWEKPRTGFPTGWGTPVVWATPGGKEVVLPGGVRLVGHDLKTGAEKWSVTGLASVGCATPVVADDGNLVYLAWSPGGTPEFKLPSFDELLKEGDANGDGVLSAAEGQKTQIKDFFKAGDPDDDGKITREEWTGMIKMMSAGKNVGVTVKPGGKGDVTATHVLWKTTKGLPYVPSQLVYGKQVYAVNNRARLGSFELATGKAIYDEENVGLTGVYASPVAADGHIYLFGLDGTGVVVKAGDTPEIVARSKFGERIAATPAIVGDTIYVRTATSLYAFSKGK